MHDRPLLVFMSSRRREATHGRLDSAPQRRLFKGEFYDHFIPLLTLGIPANATMAIIFGALLIQGVAPGPQLVQNDPELFLGVVNSMYIDNILLLIMSIPLVAFVPGSLLEENLRRSLLRFGGDPSGFIGRPISGVLLLVFVAVILLPLLQKAFKKARPATPAVTAQHEEKERV